MISDQCAWDPRFAGSTLTEIMWIFFLLGHRSPGESSKSFRPIVELEAY